MRIEPEIAFRNVDPTETVRQQIVDGIRRLEDLDDQLLACRVMVELPDRRHRHGNLYHVRIDLTRPGAELVVDRHPDEHRAHEDVGQAVGEAFDTARQRLLDCKAKRRGEVKRHARVPLARVRTVFPKEGYGFLRAEDGHDVYFHRHSVKGLPFEAMTPGLPVRFVEEVGDEGPQATVVEPV